MSGHVCVLSISTIYISIMLRFYDFSNNDVVFFAMCAMGMDYAAVCRIFLLLFANNGVVFSVFY